MNNFKKWLSENKIYLTLGLSTLSAVFMAYLGFKRGVEVTDQDNKEEQIDHLKSKANVAILKEKLEDSKKDIDEISSDVDDILDRNK